MFSKTIYNSIESTRKFSFQTSKVYKPIWILVQST